jgi:hypothetical protein
MMSKGKQTMGVLAMLVSMAFPAAAGGFTPPAEGPVAFRRDGIPLDADAMANLSKQLDTLARGLNASTPADRRGAAQMIALSLALDPANRKARELLDEYQEDRHKLEADVERLEKGRARIWQIIAWLETPEAGAQGQALAACLKDVIVISDPQHPKAAAMREAGERGAWSGWVPDVSAYDKQLVAKNEDPKLNDPTQPSVAGKTSILENAKAHTLLWQKTGNPDDSKWTLASAPLEMTAMKSPDASEDPQSFSIRIGPGGEGDQLGKIASNIRRLLVAKHGAQTRGVRISINSSQLEKSLESHKLHSISAASAVLASAALTGREPDAIILGLVDGDGNYKMPTGLWDQLQSLGKGSGRRLILPAEAATILPSILALEKPGFFMEYEVMLASDFTQLLDLAAKTPEGPLASATAKFREIRERAGTQDMRLYIANTFVKQRLMAVLQEAPAHISSKMLLTQAAGSRPTLVARTVLASELRRALEPMKWLVRNNDENGDFENDWLDSAEIAKLGQTYETCRSQVDALERYADKADRQLIERAEELTNAIRNLDRATRTRGESYLVESAVYTARGQLVRLARAVNEELATETGESNNH